MFVTSPSTNFHFTDNKDALELKRIPVPKLTTSDIEDAMDQLLGDGDEHILEKEGDESDEDYAADGDEEDDGKEVAAKIKKANKVRGISCFKFFCKLNFWLFFYVRD